MDVVKKASELKEKFDKSAELIQRKNQEIEALQDEQKRMQGEFKILIELGTELGVLDSSGNPLPQGPGPVEPEETEKKK